jgi:hypothetical protein
MTSAGVVAAAFRVCGKLSVCATTSKSFSTAKILAIPTRKIASESARIMRIGEGLASAVLRCGEEEDRFSSRALLWADLAAQVGFLEPLKLVFINDYRNTPSCSIL